MTTNQARKEARPWGSIAAAASRYGVGYQKFRQVTVGNPSVSLREIAKDIRNGNQQFGYGAQRKVAAVLRASGRTVSECAYRHPFDLLVDGWRIEVKAARLRKLGSAGAGWTFNIHRHGIIDERCDAYIFRLEDVPYYKKSVHLFYSAPLGVKGITVSIRGLLNGDSDAAREFHRFASGQMGAKERGGGSMSAGPMPVQEAPIPAEELQDRLGSRAQSRHRLEPCMGLPEAAHALGISRRTLRKWLHEELGIIFPPGKRGIKRLVRIKDLEVVQRIHAGYPDWTRMRGGSRHGAEGEKVEGRGQLGRKAPAADEAPQATAAV